jgi:hypothetical protein
MATVHGGPANKKKTTKRPKAAKIDARSSADTISRLAGGVVAGSISMLDLLEVLYSQAVPTEHGVGLLTTVCRSVGIGGGAGDQGARVSYANHLVMANDDIRDNRHAAAVALISFCDDGPRALHAVQGDFRELVYEGIKRRVPRLHRYRDMMQAIVMETVFLLRLSIISASGEGGVAARRRLFDAAFRMFVKHDRLSMELRREQFVDSELQISSSESSRGDDEGPYKGCRGYTITMLLYAQIFALRIITLSGEADEADLKMRKMGKPVGSRAMIPVVIAEFASKLINSALVGALDGLCGAMLTPEAEEVLSTAAYRLAETDHGSVDIVVLQFPGAYSSVPCAMPVAKVATVPAVVDEATNLISVAGTVTAAARALVRATGDAGDAGGGGGLLPTPAPVPVPVPEPVPQRESETCDCPGCMDPVREDDMIEQISHALMPISPPRKRVGLEWWHEVDVGVGSSTEKRRRRRTGPCSNPACLRETRLVCDLCSAVRLCSERCADATWTAHWEICGRVQKIRHRVRDRDAARGIRRMQKVAAPVDTISRPLVEDVD